MKFRNFCGESISQLGFGCMRFPIIDKDTKQIDHAKTADMIKTAIDRGVNYLDTAWTYHGGNSEFFVGEFVEKNNLRDSIYIATKLPAWLCESYEDFDRYLNEQLKKLRTDYIDFYLLHTLDIRIWRTLEDLNIKKFIKDAKYSGRVKHLGFSFHDSLESFKTIVDSNLFDFCQIQLNYMDENYQAGLEGLSYASQKGLPVIIMEPLKGGKLTFQLEGELNDIWKKHELDTTPVELALKYLYNMPELNLVLSGMSTMEQVEENIDISSKYGTGDLSPSETNLMSDLREYLAAKTKVDCTRCKYCIDCPQEIPIDEIFNLYNQAHIYDTWEYSKRNYNNIPTEKNASNCIECGECQNLCPQHISIIEALKEIHKELA